MSTACTKIFLERTELTPYAKPTLQENSSQFKGKIRAKLNPLSGKGTSMMCSPQSYAGVPKGKNGLETTEKQLKWQKIMLKRLVKQRKHL